MTRDPKLQESIRDLLHRPGEMRERQFTVHLGAALGEALAVIPAGEPIHLRLRLESVHEGVLVSATVRTTMHAECGRCLTAFTEPFEVEFQELFPYTPSEADEYGVHGDHVDLEPPLRDAVVLALPFQPVCRPDCPGLDQESGEFRAARGENAAPAVIDPRWSRLAELMTHENRGEEETPSPESK